MDEEYPFALHYLTGSKDHSILYDTGGFSGNDSIVHALPLLAIFDGKQYIELRGLGVKLGFRINERGIYPLEMERIDCATEEDFFTALDLQCILLVLHYSALR